MPAKIHEEVVAKAPPEEGMIRPIGTVRAAAAAAAEVYAREEMEKHAQATLDAWVAILKEQTRLYTRKMMAQAAKRPEVMAAGGEGPEAAFWSGNAPYPWFDLYFSGPYQWSPSANVYMPQKVIQVNDWAYLLGTLWRNPAPINFISGNPSAADMLSALNFSVWFELVNLTTVADGPDFLPYRPLPIPIGGGFVNGFFAWIPPGTFPTPPEGKPHLYEVNLTVDATGPGPVPAALPFSGFATWIFDPDSQPAFYDIPAQGPHWHYDVPARFLVHS
jgi:hypothetical protein